MKTIEISFGFGGFRLHLFLIGFDFGDLRDAKTKGCFTVGERGGS